MMQMIFAVGCEGFVYVNWQFFPVYIKHVYVGTVGTLYIIHSFQVDDKHYKRQA